MIEKIEQMEETLNRCRAAVDRLQAALDAFRQVQPDLALLEAYYGSSEWFSHLAADERGALPPGLRRGVLSQDALYDLLTDADALRRRIELTDEAEKT